MLLHQLIYISVFVQIEGRKPAFFSGVVKYASEPHLEKGSMATLPGIDLASELRRAQGILIDSTDNRHYTVSEIAVLPEYIVVQLNAPIEEGEEQRRDRIKSMFLSFDKKDAQGMWYHESNRTFATCIVRQIQEHPGMFPRKEMPSAFIDFKRLLTTPLSELLDSASAKSALKEMEHYVPNLSKVKERKMEEEEFLLSLVGKGTSHEDATHIVRDLKELGFVFPPAKEKKK